MSRTNSNSVWSSHHPRVDAGSSWATSPSISRYPLSQAAEVVRLQGAFDAHGKTLVVT
ncbi:MAG TPA: hypothetical protein VLI04_04085 [Nocardioidaceae bacterium]|nr:hypothetical protein [Nocardioidaceae bacterium]